MNKKLSICIIYVNVSVSIFHCKPNRRCPCVIYQQFYFFISFISFNNIISFDTIDPLTSIAINDKIIFAFLTEIYNIIILNRYDIVTVSIASAKQISRRSSILPWMTTL